MLSILLIGLTALEVTRISMDRAKVAETTKGALENVKADYNTKLFEDYHLLLLDRTYSGLGEGQLEQNIDDYMDYALNGEAARDEYEVSETALTGYIGVLDNDCQVLKKEINEYMKIYSEAAAVENLADMIMGSDDASDSAADAVEEGQAEEASEDSDWDGDDPRDILNDSMSGGLLSLVVPNGNAPSKTAIDDTELPSKGVTTVEQDESINLDFDDVDMLEDNLGTSNNDCITGLQEECYGIAYALSCFDYFTCEKDYNHTLKCEVEYLICGKDNDYDNLQSVVNRIVLHRLPFNYVYLLTDKKRLGEVEVIAAVLALIPGVSYAAVKYLLIGCWAYAETIVEVKSLLAGNNIPYIKTSDTWLTDLNNLGNIGNIEALDYKGADSIGYKGFLMIFLAEKSQDMYYRMCDVIQINMRSYDENFLMKNMIYAFSADVEVTGTPKYGSFISSLPGVNSLEDSLYSFKYQIETSY
jgi:hypothetical protein